MTRALDAEGRAERYRERLLSRADLDSWLRNEMPSERDTALGVALAILELVDTMDDRLGELGDAIRGEA